MMRRRSRRTFRRPSTSRRSVRRGGFRRTGSRRRYGRKARRVLVIGQRF